MNESIKFWLLWFPGPCREQLPPSSLVVSEFCLSVATQGQTKSCGAWSMDLSRKCMEVESGVLKGEGTPPPFSFMLALLWMCGPQCKRPPWSMSWKSPAEYSGVTNQGEPGSLIIVELPEQLLVISEDLNMTEIKFYVVQKQNSMLLLWGFYHLKPKQILKKVFTKSFLLDWAWVKHHEKRNEANHILLFCTYCSCFSFLLWLFKSVCREAH